MTPNEVLSPLLPNLHNQSYRQVHRSGTFGPLVGVPMWTPHACECLAPLSFHWTQSWTQILCRMKPTNCQDGCTRMLATLLIGEKSGHYMLLPAIWFCTLLNSNTITVVGWPLYLLACWVRFGWEGGRNMVLTYAGSQPSCRQSALH